VAGWKCHFIQIRWVPSRHDDTAILRVVNDFVDALGQLIHALTGVVGVHVLVFGPKMTPLESIDGSQISHFPIRESSLIEELSGAIAIPNVNVLGCQVIGVGVALVPNFGE
jgi:hypothetical protein